jgi:hypothetical protein
MAVADGHPVLIWVGIFNYFVIAQFSFANDSIPEGRQADLPGRRATSRPRTLPS